MPNVLKKALAGFAVFAPILFSSCSLVAQAVPSDVLYMRNWLERRVDFNPGGSAGYIRTEQTAHNVGTRRINPAVEPAVEFTTAIGRDGSLYLAYTTRLNSDQRVRLSAVGTDVVNTYTESLETLSDITNQTVVRTFKPEGTGIITYTLIDDVTNVGSSVTSKSPETGVWVRLLRYSSASGTWSVEFATERPADFSGIKIAFIPGRTIPYIAAVSNKNRLAVFGWPSRTSPMEFITPAGLSSGVHDLNGARNPSSMSQISTFTDGDRLYLSFIEDNRCVVGYIRGLKWLENYMDVWSGRTPSLFSMTASQGQIYGVWWDAGRQESVVASYSTNAIPSRRWLMVNSLGATEVPRIRSRYYIENQSPKLDVYLGYGYGATKYFQLAKVSNGQVSVSAPPVDGYNDRYDFDIDVVGRVMFARVNQGNTLDVGAWTRSIWRTSELPQKILTSGIAGAARQPYKTFPNSPVNTVFVDGTKPHLIFIESTGYLQLLEGLVSTSF